MINHAALAICLLGASGFYQAAFPADSSTVYQEIAPHISVRDINNALVDLKTLLEKGPVIIWFWDACCGYKKPQVRMMKNLFQTYRNQGLSIIAVNKDDSRKSADRSMAIARNRFPFPVVIDNNGDIIRKFRTISVPAVYVIGQEGSIIYSQNGYMAGDEKILEKKVQSLFAAKRTVDN